MPPRSGPVLSRRGAPKWVILQSQPSAAQHQPSSSPGQHHGHHRSQRRVVCQRQQRSAANSFQRGANSSKAMREPRGLGASALDADALQLGSMHGLDGWNSSSALAPCIRVSMGSWALMSLICDVAHAGLQSRSLRAARQMARDTNQPPGRSHGSPLATRAAVPGAFFAFLACVQPRALERARPTVLGCGIRDILRTR